MAGRVPNACSFGLGQAVRMLCSRDSIGAFSGSRGAFGPAEPVLIAGY
jgi:hypothetical protein